MVVVGLEYTLFGLFTCRRARVVKWSDGLVSRNSASEGEQRSLRQTFPNAASDERKCKCNQCDVDVGERSLTRSLKKEKFNILCILPYVLHIDLKALDIGNASSLGNPELSPCNFA